MPSHRRTRAPRTLRLEARTPLLMCRLLAATDKDRNRQKSRMQENDLEEEGDERQPEEEEESAGDEGGQQVDRDVAVREELLRRLQRLLLHYFILRELKKRS